MDTFNVFILFPKDMLSEVITDEDTYQKYLNQISDLINRADCEKGVILFYDNPQNQYHAYHLAKPTSHEEDTVAVSRIPERAKRFIDRQNKL